MIRNFSLLVVLFVLFLSQNVLSLEIHDAARNGNIDEVIRLADADPKSLYTFCSMGKTPIHWATGKNHIELLKILLNRFKVDADTRNANNGTPLHVAASQAKPDCARVLIDHGANINAQAKDGATPLHFAAFKGRLPGHIECVKILLKNGCKVNPTMNNGATPLNLATSRGNNEIISLLRTHGAEKGKINRGVNDGKYDFSGGVAGKRINNSKIPVTHSVITNTSQTKEKTSDQTVNSSFFQQRKKMILLRFDKNRDGVLDQQERKALNDMIQKRRKMMNR